MKSVRFTLFLLGVILSWTVEAGTVYVDGTKGSDTNTGLTAPEAVATLNKGSEILAFGGHDLMIVAPGVYYEQVSFTDLQSSEDKPVWIRAQIPGSVTISAMWPQAALGLVAWEAEGDGVYSAEHGPVLFASWQGTFLFRFNSLLDLRNARAYREDPVTGEALVDLAMPGYGIAVEYGRVFLRLPGGTNPNGQPVLLSPPAWDEEGWLDAVVAIHNSPYLIIDGFRVEGSGTNCIYFDPDSVGPTVRNTVLNYCVLGLRLPDDAIVEWTEYSYPGFHDFAEQVRVLNPWPEKKGIRSVYDLVKVYHEPVWLEGAIAESYGWMPDASRDCVFRYNYMHQAFDGERLGSFEYSESHHNVYLYNYDNHLELESWAGFGARELRVHDSLFLAGTMGPLSHQGDSIAGPQYVYRNVVHYLNEHGRTWTQIKSMAPNAPDGSIRYYHNLIWGGDNLLFWKSREMFRFRNNIFIFTHNQDEENLNVPLDSDYNILVNDVSKPWIQGPDPTGIYLDDPAKVGFLGSDVLEFGLLPGSPAENAGEPLPGFNEDAPGGPDIGPFETGTTMGPDWPRPRKTVFTCEPPERWNGAVPSSSCGDVPEAADTGYADSGETTDVENPGTEMDGWGEEIPAPQPDGGVDAIESGSSVSDGMVAGPDQGDVGPEDVKEVSGGDCSLGRVPTNGFFSDLLLVLACVSAFLLSRKLDADS